MLEWVTQKLLGQHHHVEYACKSFLHALESATARPRIERTDLVWLSINFQKYYNRLIIQFLILVII